MGVELPLNISPPIFPEPSTVLKSLSPVIRYQSKELLVFRYWGSGGRRKLFISL